MQLTYRGITYHKKAATKITIQPASQLKYFIYRGTAYINSIDFYSK